MYKELLPLKTQEYVVFYSPIEGVNNLIRIGYSTSFLDSVLNAIVDDGGYFKLDDIDKIKYTDNLKKKIINDRIIELSLEKSVESIKLFKYNIAGIIYYFYNYIEKVSEEMERPTFQDAAEQYMFETVSKSLIKRLIRSIENKNEYEVLCEILSLESVYDILDEVFKSFIDNDPVEIKTCKKHLIVSFNNYISSLEILNEVPQENKDYLLKLLNTILKEVLNDSEFELYKPEINLIKKIDKNINYTSVEDDKLVKIIEEQFQSNILFLDAKTRLPLLRAGEEKYYFKYESSVIILCFETGQNGYKYETVCKLITKSKLHMKFLNTDPIVVNFIDKISTKEVKEVKEIDDKVVVSVQNEEIKDEVVLENEEVTVETGDVVTTDIVEKSISDNFNIEDTSLEL